MTRRGPSHSGPYGLACTNCFRSKSKCVARKGHDGETCQRCHRLNKDCHPSDSSRGRSTEKKKTSTARITELESKVDNLLSQLQSRDGRDVAADSNDQNATSGSHQYDSQELVSERSSQPAPALSSPSSDDRMMESIGVDDNQADHFAAAVQSGSSTSDSSRHAMAHESSDRESAADALLATFRSQILYHFPFMHIPSGFTAQDVQGQWPTLLAAIVCVTTTSGGTVARNRDLKRLICEAMIGYDQGQTNSKRMDLLLALMTYLAWGCDHHFSCGSMPRLMVQAVSLAEEMMQLDAADPGEQQRMMEPAARFFGHDQPPDESNTTAGDFFLDKRRAILGCFVLSSAVSAYFGRTNVISWTMQMEESLAAISVNQACPTDAAFAVQVRLQLLAEKGLEIHRQQKMDNQLAVNEPTTASFVISLMSLQGKLQELRASLSPQVPHWGLAMAHSYSIELTLNEITHAVTSTAPVMIMQFDRMIGDISAGNSIVDDTTQTNTARCEQGMSRWQCIRSSKACILALVNLSPAEFCRISFIQWAQIARSIAVLHYLTNTIEDQSWDRNAVRKHIDIPQLLDHVIEKLQGAAPLAGPQGPDNAFTLLAHKIRGLRNGITDSHAQQSTTQHEAEAAWERWRANGGGRGASSCSVTRLANVVEDTPWLDDYLIGWEGNKPVFSWTE